MSKDAGHDPVIPRATDVVPRTTDRFTLRDQTVIVTGAGRGLGRSMALASALAGATVIGVSRSVEQLDETRRQILAQDGNFVAVPWDLSDPSDFEQLARHVENVAGGVHGVVHAAGVQLRKPAIEVSPDDWRFVQAVNLEAPFFLSTAIARRQLAASQEGSHVFVGSLGSTIGLAGISPYCASKAGTLGVVRALALEWAPSRIRVNALCPGYYETDLTADLLSEPARRKWVLSRIPMGRLGMPEDLAGAVVFLLSGASAYCTGQVLNVDGGWLAG